MDLADDGARSRNLPLKLLNFRVPKSRLPATEFENRSLRPTNQSLRAGHYLTINVTGILTGGTLELELVAVTVIVKVPAGVPGGGGDGGAEPPRGGGAEPPPQPMQSSTANVPAAKTQRGMRLLALSR